MGNKQQTATQLDSGAHFCTLRLDALVVWGFSVCYEGWIPWRFPLTASDCLPPPATLSSVTDTHEIDLLTTGINSLKSQTSLLVHKRCANSSLTEMHMQARICAHKYTPHPLIYAICGMLQILFLKKKKNKKQTTTSTTTTETPRFSYQSKEEHFSVQE